MNRKNIFAFVLICLLGFSAGLATRYVVSSYKAEQMVMLDYEIYKGLLKIQELEKSIQGNNK